MQLDSDIDADQVRYFRAIAATMSERARIILCNAEPHWIYEKKYEKKYGGADRRFSASNLRFLEDKVFNRKIEVFLSGDLHHYRRHSDRHGHHKIVAGGGGAFLHPTHDADVSVLPGLKEDHAPYVLEQSYPTVEISKKLTWRNLLFPVINWRFGITTAVLYLLTWRALQTDLSKLGLGDIAAAANQVAVAALRGPSALLWLIFIIAGALLFTETHSLAYRIAGGLTHAAAHLASVFFLGWGVVCLVSSAHLSPALELLSIGALVFAAGWVVGSIILGVYLYVSLNWFGRHANEAFSSLAIPDWKNFLRLHIDRDGALRIYPVGIDRVPRRWKSSSRGPRLVSADPSATAPRLIEAPIVVHGHARAPGPHHA